MSYKVGRNDPCPCGSGKKYKHCCMRRHKLFPRRPPERDKKVPGILALVRFSQRLKHDPKAMDKMAEAGRYLGVYDMRERIQEMWDFEKIGKMSTDEIISDLEAMNVKFSVEEFRKKAENYLSSLQLAEEYYLPQSESIGGSDEDFLLLAIDELWKRFLPDLINMEMIANSVEDGYEALYYNRIDEGMEKWSQAWEMLKVFMPPHVTSVEDVDAYLQKCLYHTISNWCQDYEEELEKLGVNVDKKYFRKRFEFCTEFYDRFPDSDKEIIDKMRRAVEDSRNHLR